MKVEQLVNQLIAIPGIDNKEVIVLLDKEIYLIKEINYDVNLLYLAISLPDETLVGDFKPEFKPLGSQGIKKPPLGIMPKKIWMEQRMQDLAEVIKRNLKERPYSEKIGEWIRELDWLITEYRKGEK